MEIKKRMMLPGSKWHKHQELMQNAELSDYLPYTELYSERALRSFLQSYDTVYIKPDRGFGGLNIFRVEQRSDGKYDVTMQTTHKTLRDQQAIHDWVMRRGRLKKKNFLIQNGIELAKYLNRPFDMRVVVQRNESKKWEITGLSAKVAGANLAVTNVARGGEIMEVADCLAGIGYDEEEIEDLTNEMGTLALQVARHLGKSYDNAIYGLDIGIDRSGGLWLIEVNTKPALDLFKDNLEHPMNLRTRELYQWNYSINKKA